MSQSPAGYDRIRNPSSISMMESAQHNHFRLWNNSIENLNLWPPVQLNTHQPKIKILSRYALSQLLHNSYSRVLFRQFKSNKYCLLLRLSDISQCGIEFVRVPSLLYSAQSSSQECSIHPHQISI